MRDAIFSLLLMLGLTAQAETQPFGKGKLTVTNMAPNAVRIQYTETDTESDLPDWLYLSPKLGGDRGLSVNVDADRQVVTISDSQGNVVFTANRHNMSGSEATLAFLSPADEHLFGLGQFQDGYSNVRGLSRRLTQVNTQISIPMLLSSKGYGILWNNYGLVDFNPADQSVKLLPKKDGDAAAGQGSEEVVNVTSTEGGRQEVRRRNLFKATIDIATPGDYSLLLDVGQTMARRHNLAIDGKTVIEMQNMWLPPTASAIVRLDAGRHTVTAELSRGDNPTLFYKNVTDETVFRSPVATGVDYTVFVGSPDEIISTYRELTGTAPLMPQWALGYIHCRERFHSSDEILTTANRFRSEQLPVDVLVQDWQYWGKYGWNAMRFDEDHYPDPKALTDSLHRMDMRLMLSVWSKIDKNSEVGREMSAKDYYIPGTDWIDFFNPDAAAAYWKNFSSLLVPLGIDAWWQDATEPENDDLAGRRVNGGRWAGEQVRNVYPLLVNKTVYEGLTSVPGSNMRPMILTRCGFPGIQRYGSAMWSGDVGNDWETLRRQIVAGLGMQAAGIPWWTYDAGGFFRPGNQYTDKDYIERMLRWIETAVYLPLMRVHGYMSNTEPWNYGSEAQSTIALCLQRRYQLLPYIYSYAAAIAFNGSTLMRPLVFDFADDAQALAQRYEYMFGEALLVSPVVEPGVTTWKTYLPKNTGGWYDFHTSRHYNGGQTVTTGVNTVSIPVFARAGSIIPLNAGKSQSTANASPDIIIRVFPGADATFTLYEDDGTTTDYKQGKCSRITFQWNDARQELTIGKREGKYADMPATRSFNLMLPTGEQKSVIYTGKRTVHTLAHNPVAAAQNNSPVSGAVSCNGDLAIAVKDNGYVISYKQQPVLELPAIGFEGQTPAAANLALTFTGKVTADYNMLAGKRLHCTNEANEYRANLSDNVTLVMRLYNDGIAYRYELKGMDGQKLPKELTTYRIPEGTKRWIQQWTDAYEGFFPLTTTYKTKPVRSFSAVSTSADGWNNRWGYPALVEPADGVFALITEANIERQQSASCLYSDGELYRVTPDDNDSAVNGQWSSPWRVVIMGSLADIVASTLVTDVSNPCQLKDTSWIHPGVVSWIYWAYNHGSNDFSIIKKYVDMAVTLKLPYVLIDAEWDTMDKVKANEGKTVEDAVAYAKAQGIKPMIWYNSCVGWIDGAPTPKFRLNKPEDREREFAWCERIGVAGVKVDFFSGDNLRNMDYCLDLMECAARHHLLINFHGATIPRGWQRTYPNLLTTEAVYGAEWYNNVPTFTKQAASHNATLPFTRNVIGPMDYTPCTFSDSQHPHITSNSHELALTVLYESGLQHLADRPESYLSQPEQVQQFLSTLPAVWDETRLVSGYPGEHAVMARRSGNTWYVAGINGTDNEQTVILDLGFLDNSHRQAMVFADNDGKDSKWLIGNATLPKRATVTCQPRGGFVWVVKAN